MEGILSADLRSYLKHCGLSDNKIALCSGSTRMYHDLCLYGDIAEACIEVLAERYNVDLSGFEFDKFFPQEFVGKSRFARVLLWILPYAGSFARKRACPEYKPLTLDRIDQAIRTKKWQ